MPLTRKKASQISSLELNGTSANTYAKKKKRLQQRLDVYWILHNFVRVHFTTNHVPAVALGIIEQGLSLAEIFSIPCVWN